jgi:hypothetical protein
MRSIRPAYHGIPAKLQHFHPTTGKRFDQIPNSSYTLESLGDDEDPTGTSTTPETKVLDIPAPSDGTYTLQVFGTGTGPFTLDFIGYDSAGNPSLMTMAGNAGSGTEIDYKVGYSSVPGSHITVTPVDVTPPTINGMPTPGTVLWPPNHKMVQVAVVSATDLGTGVASFDVTGSSNESSDPLNPDIVITGSGVQPRVVNLRADRLGSGSGRIYTLIATATDGAGNKATATATVIVPHDQGH